MLQPGARLTISGRPYRVEYVNPTGAYVVPEHKIVRTIHGHDRKGRPVTRVIESQPEGMVISLDSQPS